MKKTAFFRRFMAFAVAMVIMAGMIALPGGVSPLALTYQEGMIKDQNGVNVNPGVSDGAVTILNVMIGDVDGDGMITPYDATLILQHIVGIITLEGKALAAADVDRDSVVAPYDATLILQYIVGIITEFPQ